MKRKLQPRLYKPQPSSEMPKVKRHYCSSRLSVADRKMLSVLRQAINAALRAPREAKI